MKGVERDKTNAKGASNGRNKNRPEWREYEGTSNSID